MTYTVYFISHEHVIILLSSVGRDYAMSDRVRTEQRIELLQSGDRLDNLKVTVEIKARVYFTKACPLKDHIA
jgi:hypothetical protein